MRYLRPRELERTYDSIWAWVGSFGEGLRKQGVLSMGYSQTAGTVLGTVQGDVAVHLSTFHP